jgi:hypothetical protein
MINMVNPPLAARLCPQRALAARALCPAPIYEQLAHLAPLEPLGVIAASLVLCRSVSFADISASHWNELEIWNATSYLRDN